MNQRPVQTVLPVGPNGLPIGAMTGSGTASIPGGPGAASQTSVTIEYASRLLQVSVTLDKVRAKEAIDLKGMKRVSAFTIRSLSGAGADAVRIHPAADADGLQVAAGEVRDGLALAGLWLTSTAAGGSLSLEVHGV